MNQAERNAINDKEEQKPEDHGRIGNVLQKPTLYQTQRSFKLRQSMKAYKPMKAKVEVPHPNNNSQFFDRMLHNPDLLNKPAADLKVRNYSYNEWTEYIQTQLSQRSITRDLVKPPRYKLSQRTSTNHTIESRSARSANKVPLRPNSKFYRSYKEQVGQYGLTSFINTMKREEVVEKVNEQEKKTLVSVGDVLNEIKNPENNSKNTQEHLTNNITEYQKLYKIQLEAMEQQQEKKQEDKMALKSEKFAKLPKDSQLRI